LKAEFEATPSKTWSWESEMNAAAQASENWARPSPEADPFFDQRTYLTPNHYRASGERPHLHIGTVGSANTLLKDAIYRDALRKEHKTVAYEMEGAGLAITAPIFDAQYIVVRGICDYGDSSKNDDWQKYASVAPPLSLNVSSLCGSNRRALFALRWPDH
jgi:nucleoside phosphorylase